MDDGDGGAFRWSGGDEAAEAVGEAEVADGLVEHVEACLRHVRSSSWGQLLEVEALDPHPAEVATLMLTGEVPDRGSRMAWNALEAVVRPMVLGRLDGPEPIG